METTDALLPYFQGAISAALKELLSQKHLYQSSMVDYGFVPIAAKKVAATKVHTVEPLSQTGRRMLEAHSHEITQVCHTMKGMQWLMYTPNPLTSLIGKKSGATTGAGYFEITPPTVRTTCAACKESQPFNPVTEACSMQASKISQIDQWLLLTYECQNCKGEPIRYLIRRKGPKLQLCGRDPFEFIALPNYIPKECSEYLSNAIIAHNAGQTLAGVFLLRVFVEQFWRSVPAIATKLAKTPRLTGDEMGSLYQESLPLDFKSRFPSLKEAYDKLSEAMHAATPDGTLFEAWSVKVQEHFDARRIYRLA